jgi:hypothetical protein
VTEKGNEWWGSGQDPANCGAMRPVSPPPLYKYNVLKPEKYTEQTSACLHQFFFSKHGTIIDAHIYIYALTSINTHTHPIRLASKKLIRRVLRLTEVTTCALFFTGTSPPTEKYTAFMRHQSVKSVI